MYWEVLYPQVGHGNEALRQLAAAVRATLLKPGLCWQERFKLPRGAGVKFLDGRRGAAPFRRPLRKLAAGCGTKFCFACGARAALASARCTAATARTLLTCAARRLFPWAPWSTLLFLAAALRVALAARGVPWGIFGEAFPWP